MGGVDVVDLVDGLEVTEDIELREGEPSIEVVNESEGAEGAGEEGDGE